MSEAGMRPTPVKEREFDAYAADYEKLLRDPWRQRFAGSKADYFHRRKCDFLVSRFARRNISTRHWSYLDVGCGRGELLRLLAREFAETMGCDPSPEMLRAAPDGRIALQKSGLELPFSDCRFDLVTAVCVFHHVRPEDRLALTREARRVLKPGGTFCVIEHNPFNPVTRVIVSRAPVDADAQLLSHWEAKRMARDGGLRVEETSFFLYLPGAVYRRWACLEDVLRGVPLGGQYAVFARK